jgi:hypothetical protein
MGDPVNILILICHRAAGRPQVGEPSRHLHYHMRPGVHAAVVAIGGMLVLLPL